MAIFHSHGMDSSGLPPAVREANKGIESEISRDDCEEIWNGFEMCLLQTQASQPGRAQVLCTHWLKGDHFLLNQPKFVGREKRQRNLVL